MKNLLFSEKWLTNRAEVILSAVRFFAALRMTGGEGLRALAHPRNDMVERAL